MCPRDADVVQSDRNEDAIAAYEEILKTSPDSLIARNNVIALYDKIGSKEKAAPHRQWLAQKKSSAESTAKSLKVQFGKMGYPAEITQKGNSIEVKPTYYEKNKTPATDLELRVIDEYKREVAQATQALTDSPIERNKVTSSIAQKFAKKYHMTDENFMYFTLKMLYSEKPPTSYVPPSE